MQEKTPSATIDEYIAGYPADVQAILQQIRQTIREAAPDAQEMVNYGVPTFTLHGNLVHFGASKNHIGFYPTPGGIAHFQEELAGYKTAKGSVQFPYRRPIPYDLIRRIVAFRVEENVARAAAPGKRRPNSPTAE